MAFERSFCSRYDVKQPNVFCKSSHVSTENSHAVSKEHLQKSRKIKPLRSEVGRSGIKTFLK
ncbi:MAG: hypothetical protein BHW39_05970 [Firmicutes bacterium CAG:552_39_19]|nr:MAG: hypothetical protein BHW39_05970 [Firmicutes bacterium CAG:552_39_19]